MNKKWIEVSIFSKIILEKDTIFPSLSGEKQKLKAGEYYVKGFWANACGISKDKNKMAMHEFIIPSFSLTKFKGIIK